MFWISLWIGEGIRKGLLAFPLDDVLGSIVRVVLQFFLCDGMTINEEDVGSIVVAMSIGHAGDGARGGTRGGVPDGMISVPEGIAPVTSIVEHEGFGRLLKFMRHRPLGSFKPGVTPIDAGLTSRAIP